MAESVSEAIARQNDRQAAIEEFRQNYRISPNAEELIAANNASYSAALREASLTPLDEKATAELDVDKLASKTTVSGSKVSDLGEPMSAAVRGNAIVVVVKRDDGRLVKEVVPANDKYVAPRETPSEAMANAQVLTTAELTEEVFKLRQELAAELAELRREKELEYGSKIADAQEEIGSKAEEAAKEALKEQKKADKEGAKEHPRTRGTGDASEKAGGKSQQKAGDKPKSEGGQTKGEKDAKEASS